MDYFWSKRFLVALASLAVLCGLSGCTYDLVVRAGYANPSGVYSAVEGPAAAGSGDAGVPVGTPDGGHRLGSNANYAYAVGFGANNVAWSTAYATPEISVATPTADVATVPLLIQSQAPWASAATNVTAGNIVLNIPASISGTHYGAVVFEYNGGVLARFQAQDGVGTNQAMYLGTVSPSNLNYSLLTTGVGDTRLNATSNVILGINNAPELNVSTASVSLTPPALSWVNSAVAPNVSQVALASTSAGSGAAGQGMSVTAQAGQAATGLTNNGGAGGNLALSAGTGGTSGSATAGIPGYVTIGAGGTVLQLGNLFGQANATYGAIYPGAVVPSATNYLLFTSSTGSLVNLNTTSGGTINFTSGGSTDLQVSSTGVSFGAAIGGLSGIGPLHYNSTGVALTSGASNVISSTNQAFPHIKFTGTLTGAGTTVTFPATDGACWDLDFSAVTTIADSISLIANGVTWGTPVASVGTEFPHVCYSAGAGRLVGTAMTEWAVEGSAEDWAAWAGAANDNATETTKRAVGF